MHPHVKCNQRAMEGFPEKPGAGPAGRGSSGAPTVRGLRSRAPFGGRDHSVLWIRGERILSTPTRV